MPIKAENALLSNDYITKIDAFDELNRLFSNPDVTVIMHNAKYDYEVLRTNGFALDKSKVSKVHNASEQLLFDVETIETKENKADKAASSCFACEVFDTMIASWLLEPDGVGKSPFSLESIAERLLHLKGIEFDEALLLQMCLWKKLRNIVQKILISL